MTGVVYKVKWSQLRPDSRTYGLRGVVALLVADGSGVLCLEIDEATEHAPQIRSKLEGYRRVLPARAGWHVVFVVPTVERLAWLQRVGRDLAGGLGGRAWVVVLGDLEGAGVDAFVAPIGGGGERRPLVRLLDNPLPRPCPTPVGSEAWVRLLGTGGGEDLDEALR